MRSADTDVEMVEPGGRDTDAVALGVCTCPEDGFSESCAWARLGLGHVKACPETGKPCPCAEGSISYAHCWHAVREALDQRRAGTK